MRLTKQQTEEISKVILKKLKGMDMVTVNVPEDKVLHRIVEIITKDLMVEEELDREVKKFLETYEADFKSGKLEYMKMFNKIKEKLVKERDLTI
ncbi:MAG: hypothetical protein HW415_1216 [Deltaproteobacteria bacterium]|nr:hypothetical protein [Deltaproteobacteria bacterium]